MPATLANEAYLAAVLAQLLVIILTGRVMNRVFVRIGQPGAVGEIVGGLMLGPSLLGLMAPEFHADFFAKDTAKTLFVIGQIGLILLMFEIGADFEFGHLNERRHLRATVLTTVLSIAVPFGCGVGVGLVTHGPLAAGIDRTIYTLFCGVALAITAVPILGRILREYGLNRTPVGVIAIASAAVNDVVGWLILGAISALALATLGEGFILWRLLALAALGLSLRFLLAPLVDRMMQFWRDDLARGQIPHAFLAVTIALAFGCALATETIGIFAIFGGFALGLVYHRHPQFVGPWKQSTGQFVLVFFLPIFFTLTGLRTNIWGLGVADLPWLALILAAAIGSKIIPCYIAGRLSGLSKPESWLLGSLMNTRALMELIVLNIAYDLGFLPQKVFTMLVLMAVITTMMTGPLLRLILPKMGHPLPDPAASREA
ncbi:MAG: cation:proton antiporter [Sandaracinobacteroides sp.]